MFCLCVCTELCIELWPVGETCTEHLAWWSGHHRVPSRRRSMGGHLDIEQRAPQQPRQVRHINTPLFQFSSAGNMFNFNQHSMAHLSVSSARKGWAGECTLLWRFQWRLITDRCSAELTRWTTSTPVLRLPSTNRCVRVNKDNRSKYNTLGAVLWS